MIVQSQDTVALAWDSLAPGLDSLVSAALWIAGVLAVLTLLFLTVLVLVLVEVRKLSRSWTGFARETQAQFRPVIEHAAAAARNVDELTASVRAEVERLNQAVGGVAGGIDEAAAQVRTRLADLSAVLDFAQSEAEDAVLDAAAKLRTVRAGAGWLARRSVARPREADGGEGGDVVPGDDGSGEAPPGAAGDA